MSVRPSSTGLGNGYYLKYINARSLGALRVLISSRRPFTPLDIVLRAFQELRPCNPGLHPSHKCIEQNVTVHRCKTLPEAQRTQGIDSLTEVISPAK